MLPVLFAFRTSWVGMLILVGCAFVVYFVVRVIIDTVVWFREEFVDATPRRSKQQRESDRARKGPGDGAR